MSFDKDYFGAIISGICLIHCLAGPLLLLIGVTSFSHSFIEERDFHFVLIAPILFFAAWSIPKGIKRHHHPLPAILTLFGVSFLTIGLIIIDLSLMLSSLASCMLIFAHLYNRKLMKNVISTKEDE